MVCCSRSQVYLGEVRRMAIDMWISRHKLQAQRVDAFHVPNKRTRGGMCLACFLWVLYICCWLVVWNINVIFPYIGNNHPNWLIFFRGVQTTNQFCIGCILAPLWPFWSVFHQSHGFWRISCPDNRAARCCWTGLTFIFVSEVIDL